MEIIALRITETYIKDAYAYYVDIIRKIKMYHKTYVLLISVLKS